METGRARAVIACMDACGARRMAGILDEAGYDAAATVHSARDVLPALRTLRPRLLLAEAILPGGDGASLARAVAGASLNLYPHVLLTAMPQLRLPGFDVPDGFGAALLREPLTPGAIMDAVAALEARATSLPPDRDAKLDDLLNRLGVPEHPGRGMLKGAVALCWRDRSRLQNLRDRVYPAAAVSRGGVGAQAERGIRHVIDAAWRTGAIDEQQRIFGDTIDARRGRPTCGEMIAQLADILRWEG